MKFVSYVAAACIAVSLAACTSTTFTSTWKAPDAQPLDPAGRRVAAVFISTDESSRRAAEDALVSKLNERGAQGIASYTLIPSRELRDMDRVRAYLAEAGVDGVVTMRVIDERERTSTTYTAPRPFAHYYWNLSSYWGYGWGLPYTPAEVTTDTILRVETLVYSLDRDELLWAGTSRTVNPAKVPEFVEEVADTAAKQMTRQGLLPEGNRRVAAAPGSG
jgi:hypothetical protein